MVIMVTTNSNILNQLIDFGFVIDSKTIASVKYDAKIPGYQNIPQFLSGYTLI